MKNKLIKVLYFVFSIILVTPSLLYLMQNKTVMGFDIYYHFFLKEESNKVLATTLYLILLVALYVTYLWIVKQKPRGIKRILTYVAIASIIFIMMLPWTSSDIFYYMGVGELDARYSQNPYYISMTQYREQNMQTMEDPIFTQGANGVWADTTVVYGPMAQLIFKVCTFLSVKNIDLCLFIFKLVNVLLHIANCYFIYRLSNQKMAIIYGLNPFILIEFIGNVHNDIIVVFLILLSIYFLRKKKNLIASVIILALATGIKYFTVLLLPVMMIWYVRDEKHAGKRLIKCIQYGCLFVVILLLEYALYFKDVQIFIAMFAQTAKYSKSLHSALLQESPMVMEIVKFGLTICFLCYYIKFCITLLRKKAIKWYQAMRKYHIALFLFLLILTTFQQWYLIWAFATVIWQKAERIEGLIGLTASAEVANTVYMYQVESYIYDIYFVGLIVCLFFCWQIFAERRRKTMRTKDAYKIERKC